VTLQARKLIEALFRLFRRRHPVVRQYDRTDCGAASLLSVLRYHGGDAPLVTVRELSHTGVQGTSMWSLREAAEALGFEATGARGSYKDLCDTRPPCIAHLILEDGRPHFVVVFRKDHRRVLIGDPARGLIWIDRESFKELWRSRAVLLLSPTDRLCRKAAPHWMTWVLKYFRREAVWVTQALFMGFVYSILALVTALFVRVLIDRFIPAGDVGRIAAIGGGLLILQLVRGGVGYLRSWLLIELNRRVNVRMTKETLHHLFGLPSCFFESRRTGDITARINDSVRIHAALLNVLGNTAIDVVMVIGSLVFLQYLAPSFVWVALVFVAALCVVAGLGYRFVRRHEFNAKQAYASVQASYIDSICAIDPIRSVNSASLFGRSLGRMYEQLQAGLARLGIVQARVSLVIEMLAAGLIVATLTAGAVLVVREAMTLGTMMAAYSLMAGTVPATARVIEASLQIQEASVAATRLFDLLLVQPERNEGSRMFRMSRGLTIRHGEFCWPGGKPLLHDIDIEIPKGRLTALCGPSGVGKSTLVKILDRRYGLREGRLQIDGVPADDIELSSYRDHVATLPESVAVINGTIAENILLGREVADHNPLLERIESLGLARFLSRFPNGLFTLIGDEGRLISSGERQTIGLLRALWGEPDVLLVDEGMNAVDFEIARILTRALIRYATDHAVLVVSHSPQTLLQAGYIYVLREGTIAAHGEPADLLAGSPDFATFFPVDSAVTRSA
jgi:ATP-binding cassette subfamily B protein